MTQQPIARRVLDIDAPAAEVWAVISDPWELGYISRVRKVERADGDVRVVHIGYEGVEGYADVQIAYERVFDIDHAAHTYKYSWSGDYLPIADHVATVKIHETGPATSRFEWSCVWRLTEPWPAEQERELAQSVEDIWWTGMTRVKEIAEG